MSSRRNKWREESLGEICEFKYGKSLPANKRIAGSHPVYGSNGTVGQHNQALTAGPTIIIGRKGSLGEIHYSHTPCWPIDTTYYVDSSSTSEDLRWLSYRLAALGLKNLNRAAAIPGLNREDAYRKRVLVPPLEEQRRIVEVLDRADELRTKRRQALAHLDDLAQSIFLDMFGDPRTNPKGFPKNYLVDVLAAPLRNGISPSSSGGFRANVLTLSSITGGEFNRSAVKVGTFTSSPEESKRVQADDFLICRGNGNLNLVGRGVFPTESMPDTVFPDTVIGARVDYKKIRPAFLQQVWNSPAVRTQIEAAVRTTSGIFKINQRMLEKICFYYPSLPLQDEFSRAIAPIEQLKAMQREQLAELDALFASLQDRAFQGRL